MMKLKKLFWLIACLPLLLAGCRDEERTFLFEMTFPEITFEIPGGLNNFNSYIFALDELPTNIDFYLNSSGVDTAVITAINPVFARITALDTNVDFNYIREVAVRVCAANSGTCNDLDEVFYIDDFNVIRGGVIDLLPSLLDAREELLQEKVRLEIEFNFYTITPYPVNNRFELIFDAVQ